MIQPAKMILCPFFRWGNRNSNCVDQPNSYNRLLLCLCAIVSDSLRCHGLYPTRLLCPWDFPGKNTGVGCHFSCRQSSRPRDQTRISCSSCIDRQILYNWTSWGDLKKMRLAKLWLNLQDSTLHHMTHQISSVQSFSCVWLFATPWTAARKVSLSITNSQSLLKLRSIASVMPSNHLILCCPLLLLPSIFPSIRVFSNESVLHIRWPKYWCSMFSISPSNEHLGLIFSRMDWLDLLVVQGPLKSLLQHQSSKASVLWHSVFFTVQLSHPYMTTGKIITLTRWTLLAN